MTFPRVVLATVIRVVVLTLVDVAYLAWLDAGTSSDALGAGFLFFVIVMAVALVWALIDAVRRGFVAAGLVWLLTSALAGVTINATLVQMTDDSAAGGFVTGVLFFGFLLLVPAVIGLVLGGLAYRARVALAD